MQLQRVAFDDHLPADVPDRHAILDKIRSHEAMRRVAVSLDQVHDLARADLLAGGPLTAATAKAIVAELDHAEGLVEDQARAVEVGQAMIAEMRGQLAGLRPRSGTQPPPSPGPSASPIRDATPLKLAAIDAEGEGFGVNAAADPIPVAVGGPEQFTIPPEVSDAEVRAADIAESEMGNPDAAVKTGGRRRR